MDLQDAKSLLDLIDDPDERVRTTAVRALVRLPLTIEAWRVVQTAVLRLLREDGPPTWRREVITSAAFVPFKSMRSELASLLRAPSPDTRDAAALALALARDRRALEPLLAQLGTEDSTTRLAAAEALARLDPLELLGAADRLREHLRSEPEVEVRFWLALALARSSRLLALAELLDDPPNELFDKLPDLTELEGQVRDNGPAAAGVAEEFGELAELRGPNWGAGFADAILAGWRAAARQAQTDGQQPPPLELHRSRPDVTRLLATYRRLVERAERKEMIEQVAWTAAQGGARWLLTGLAPKLAAGDTATRALACRLIEQAASYLDLVGAPVFGSPQLALSSAHGVR